MQSITDLNNKLQGEGNLNPSHSCKFNAGVNNILPEPGEGIQGIHSSAGEHLKCSTDIPVAPTSSLALSASQLKCLFVNSGIKRNKQEELETCVYARLRLGKMWALPGRKWRPDYLQFANVPSNIFDLGFWQVLQPHHPKQLLVVGDLSHYCLFEIQVLITYTLFIYCNTS